jgi:hypothetical protein
VVQVLLVAFSLSKINKKGVAKDTFEISEQYFKKYKIEILRAVAVDVKGLNSEKIIIIVRVICRMITKGFDFSLIKHLKGVNIKIIISTILSELKLMVMAIL